MSVPERTRDYLSDRSLVPMWSALRSKLERSRLAPTGAVMVVLDERGAERLAGLLATPVAAGRVRVQLAALDTALRQSAAQAGVATVTELLTGSPLVDRSAVRDTAAASWSATWASLDASLAAAGLAGAEWVPGFVEGVRRSGLLTRAGVDAALVAVRHSGTVLAELADGLSRQQADVRTGSDPWCELAELASACTGDSHGLDDGRLAGALVLRAGAAALMLPVPESAAARRDLWNRLGVTTDLVSGTVLMWGLRPPGGDGWSAMMRARADLGVVTHLTLQELRGAGAHAGLTAEGGLVSVCENPQVLQAAARAGVRGPLLCVAGNPASVGWLVLRRLLHGGARVRYHGDFDWPGAAIAGRIIAAGAQPWRMCADDYVQAVAALPADRRLTLTGSPVETGWDPRLAVAMRRHGVAVHEESILTPLLADLVGGCSGVPA